MEFSKDARFYGSPDGGWVALDSGPYLSSDGKVFFQANISPFSRRPEGEFSQLYQEYEDADGKSGALRANQDWLVLDGVAIGSSYSKMYEAICRPCTVVTVGERKFIVETEALSKCGLTVSDIDGKDHPMVRVLFCDLVYGGTEFTRMPCPHETTIVPDPTVHIIHGDITDCPLGPDFWENYRRRFGEESPK